MNIYITRHGQNEDNANGILNGHRDLPLTEIGKNQAQEIAEKIKNAGLVFDVVLSSPLIRALDTAKVICKVNNFPPAEIMPDLIERDFGAMTGVKQSQIEELCSPDIIKTDTITYFLTAKNAETFPELKSRANKILNKLEQKYPSAKNILLVTHGDFGKMIFASYYNLDWKDALTDFHFGNSDLLLLSKNISPEDSQVFKIKQHNI